MNGSEAYRKINKMRRELHELSPQETLKVLVAVTGLCWLDMQEATDQDDVLMDYLDEQIPDFLDYYRKHTS
jgi:hypothetical protein